MMRHRVRLLDNIIELCVATLGSEPDDAEVDPGPPSGSEGSGQDVFIRIRVEQSVGWRNDTIRGVAFETDGLGVERVVVEQPVVSGAFRHTPWGLEGAFRVGGDGVSSIDGLMSLGLSLRCERNGDLLLHASAVEEDGRVLLFLGPGGSGKTTIATELDGGRPPFCLDKALVSARPDGKLRVCSTPFGEGMAPSWRQRSGELGGLFFIEQAAAHELEPLSQWAATILLLAQTIAPTRATATIHGVMEMVGRLVDLGRSYRLRFAKNDGFWPLIEALSSKGG
jgi:hypothetical protein